MAFGLLPPALFGVPSEKLRERMFDEKPKVMPTDTRGSFMIQGLSKMRHQLLSRLPGHQRAINKKELMYLATKGLSGAETGLQ